MKGSARVWSLLVLAAVAGGRAGAAQVGGGAAVNIPPGGYGSLTQNDLALRIKTPDVEVRFVPLDARVTRLLAKTRNRAVGRGITPGGNRLGRQPLGHVPARPRAGDLLRPAHQRPVRSSDADGPAEAASSVRSVSYRTAASSPPSSSTCASR